MTWMRPILLVILATLSSGCGVCGEITRHRKAFEKVNTGKPKSSKPHLRLTIPKSHIDGWEKRALTQLPPSAMSIPGLGELGRYLGNLELKPREVSLKSTEDGLRVEIDLDVRRDDKRLFGLAMTAVAPTRYDRKSGRLVVKVRADLFESVKPRIEGNAVKGISKTIQDALPGPMSALVPRKRIEAVAKGALEHLVESTYKQLRSSVLSTLGTLTSFSVSIPQLPLSTVVLREHEGNWLIDVQAKIPARGLGRPMKVNQNRFRLDVSTFALAQLGNWAMKEGHLPDRFTEEGRASGSGPYRAGLRWDVDRRPVKVHLWTAEPDDAAICVRAVAAGRPRLVYEKKKLRVGFVDGKLEALVGPPLIESTLRVLGITERVFNYTRKIAVGSEVKLGEYTTKFQLQRAGIRGDVVEFELASAPPRPTR